MMLEKLLSEIRSGGTLETNTLAVKLGTTPQMVDAFLEYLCYKGYIQEYTDCGDGCHGCGLKDSCGSSLGAKAIRLWRCSDNKQ